MELTFVDLAVVGGNLAGLSLAIEAQEAGLERVIVIEPGEQVAHPAVVGHNSLRVEYRAPVASLEPSADRVDVEAGRLRLSATVVALCLPAQFESPIPKIPGSLAGQVHGVPPPIDLRARDVLVVGNDEAGAEYAWRLAAAEEASVVLACGGTDLSRLSRLARRQLLVLEAERRATILWHSQPESIAEVAGFPMVYFGDRRTPDLQFDHVVYRLRGGPSETAGETGSGRVLAIDGTTSGIAPGLAWETIRRIHFPHLPAPPAHPRIWKEVDRDRIEELRSNHYNATITVLERSHSDLWILAVEPDQGDLHHLAGQYASLGLGYWEGRADGARDPGLEKNWDRLIRRSYSISSPLFDPTGYLYDPCRSPALEFYIVLVPPADGKVPALTPRLALRRPGDRIYLGPKVAGRYTLHRIDDPSRTVVFLATGTGEAPHNAMIIELLRKGHRGPIVSVVSVRHQADLGYLERHRRLEEMFANYHYLPLVTRDPVEPKRYVQDVIGDGTLDDLVGGGLDAERTDVFLCGNPAMIGLPAGNGSQANSGACGLLVDRGFVVERRGTMGNIHVEEYW